MDLIGAWIADNSWLLILFTALSVVLMLVATDIYIARSGARKRDDWYKENVPTMAEYTKQHPDCQTPRGMRCAHCNSGSIKNLGLDNASDPRRVFRCNHCNAMLYRNDVCK